MTGVNVAVFGFLGAAAFAFLFVLVGFGAAGVVRAGVACGRHGWEWACGRCRDLAEAGVFDAVTKFYEGV